MISLPTAFARAVGQLADPAIVRVLVKSVALTLLVFAALGVGLWAALEQALESYTTGFSAEIAALVSILLAVIGGWLLFRIVAIAVIQFFADEIVMAVEKRHYPGAHAVARDLTFAESLRESLKGLGRALGANLLALPVALILLVTGIGTVLLFWLVNAWLLGRELQDIAWLRHRARPEDAPPLTGLTRFLLGGTVAALFAVPFLNLLAPVIGAAAATHLVHDRKESLPDAL
ncbi:EI24 domain-containing protein [Erythrobacter litoralis]|uniref:Membrane protein, putative n=1 Tax=Erythrobacter litoralis (strain HTCC2594) TaxID=314225 RepID=Q2N6Q4_ERYLH|nr:EI24 domain-containing protein [Erythrobacter litoralis]ABC64637.1 membrane protein, putative [Erythrobacter litoralis HTCC2594]